MDWWLFLINSLFDSNILLLFLFLSRDLWFLLLWLSYCLLNKSILSVRSTWLAWFLWLRVWILSLCWTYFHIIVHTLNFHHPCLLTLLIQVNCLCKWFLYRFWRWLVLNKNSKLIYPTFWWKISFRRLHYFLSLILWATCIQ